MIRNNYDSVAWQACPTQEALLRMRRHYAANVSMIDEKVGQIFEVLERKGYLDDAIVIFTSDHADALGDHGHIQKWTMFDCVERVPLLFWGRSRIRAGRTNDSLVQLIDVAATIMEAAEVPVPPSWESKSLWPILKEREPLIREVVYAELARDHIQSGAEYVIMRRDREWKLVYYLGETDGELFNVADDPGEIMNLWNSPAHRELRDRLSSETLEWSVRSTLRATRSPTPTPQQPMLI